MNSNPTTGSTVSLIFSFRRMGIFFGAEIRHNKDQFYIKIILDLFKEFYATKEENVYKKSKIKTNVLLEVSNHFGSALFWSLTKYLWIMSKSMSKSKNNFGPIEEERDIKNNPNRNSHNFKYFETFKIVIATHHENHERSKLCMNMSDVCKYV